MKNKPNINNLSTKPRVKIGDMVSYDLEIIGDPPGEVHGLVVEISHSIVKIRPLQDWNRVYLVNVADCRLVPKK
jgi:hypothetical protein